MDSAQIEARMRQELDGHLWAIDLATNKVVDRAAPKKAEQPQAPKKPENVMRDWLIVNKCPPGMNDVIKAFAHVTGFTVAEIKCERRSKSLVFVRHAAMYACHKWTARSYPEIGRAFGGKDHSTVIHGVRKVLENLEKFDELINKARPLVFPFEVKP